MPLPNWKSIPQCPRVKSLVAFSFAHQTQRLYPVRCKCWTCPFCAKKNLRKLILQIKECPPDRFITLTCKYSFMETPEACYNRHRPFIRKLFEKARRVFGTQEYAVFCELHKSGYPHFHILQRGTYIPSKWLHDEWRRLTGSWIVDIRKVERTADAARYVTKYVAKSSPHARINPLFRIVTFSKHFRPPKQPHRLSKLWLIEFDRQHPHDLLDGMADRYQIEWQDDHFEMRPKSALPQEEFIPGLGLVKFFSPCTLATPPP